MTPHNYFNLTHNDFLDLGYTYYNHIYFKENNKGLHCDNGPAFITIKYVKVVYYFFNGKRDFELFNKTVFSDEEWVRRLKLKKFI